MVRQFNARRGMGVPLPAGEIERGVAEYEASFQVAARLPRQPVAAGIAPDEQHDIAKWGSAVAMHGDRLSPEAGVPRARSGALTAPSGEAIRRPPH